MVRVRVHPFVLGYSPSEKGQPAADSLSLPLSVRPAAHPRQRAAPTGPLLVRRLYLRDRPNGHALRTQGQVVRG